MQDLIKENVSEYKVKIENGEISAFRSKDLQRSGMRHFSNNKISSASYIGEISDDELLHLCHQNQPVALDTDIEITSDKELSVDISPDCKVDRSSLVDEAEKTLSKLTRDNPNFIFNGHFIRTENERRYTNSNGADLVKSYTQLGTQFSVRRKGSPNIADDFIGTSNLFDLNHDSFWDLITDMYNVFDNEIKLKAGKYKVLTNAGQYLSKISDSLRADRYHEGTALYSGKNGQKILSEHVTISDIHFAPELNAVSPFDQEGVCPTHNELNLVENGVLKGQICDLKHAKRYNLKSTGNGFRSFNGSTMLGFSSLGLGPGRRSYRNILQDMDEGIFIKMAYGGDFTDKGDYSSPIQLAYWVKNGKLVGRLNQLSLNTSITRMFDTDLLEISSDGVCKGDRNPLILSEMDIQSY